MAKLKIPTELLVRNPNLNMKELRAIIKTILNAKTYILSQRTIFDIRIPGIGRLKSHGNRKVSKKVLAADAKRKRIAHAKKEFEINKLLY